MPKLIRLYIQSIAIGFALSLVFLGLLLWLDVGGLRHLVTEVPKGWIAGLMIVLSNGIVFSGVQFAIRIMGMADDDEGPKGGTRAPLTPARQAVRARARRS